MFKRLFKTRKTITATISTRDLASIKRYLADGFRLVIRGAVAVLTKTLWV